MNYTGSMFTDILDKELSKSFDTHLNLKNILLKQNEYLKTKNPGGIKMKKIYTLLLALSLTLVWGSVAFSQFKSFALTNNKSNKFFPSSAESFGVGKSDGTIICWIDAGSGGSLLAQKVLPDGSIAWSSDGIMIDDELGSILTADTDYPISFSDGSGGGIFIYRKNDEILAAGVTSQGILKRDPIILSSRFEGLNFHPRAEQANDFSIVVTWENFTLGDFNIHAQKISRDCIKLWNGGSEVIVCNNAADQRKPELAITKDALTIVTWLDTRNIGLPDSGSYDLYGTLLNESGETIFPEDRGTFIYKQRISRATENILSTIEKESDYAHKPVISGNSIYIVIDEKSVDLYGQIVLLNVSMKLEMIGSRIIDDRGTNESPIVVKDRNNGLMIFWESKVIEGSQIKVIGIDEHGKTMHGLNTGFAASCDGLKANTNRYLSISNRPAVSGSAARILSLPWVAGTGGQLFINEISLTDESEACTGVQLVNQGLTSVEHTSVTTQAGSLVIVYNLAQDIFVSVRELPKDRNLQNVNEGRIANYPNPFNPTTSIDYYVPTDGFVRLSVFDLTGKEIAILENGHKYKGEHKAVFDGTGMATGMYFYRLEVNSSTSLENGGRIYIGKMMMIK